VTYAITRRRSEFAYPGAPSAPGRLDVPQLVRRESLTLFVSARWSAPVAIAVRAAVRHQLVAWTSSTV
jgi:hypothetical protein